MDILAYIYWISWIFSACRYRLAISFLSNTSIHVGQCPDVLFKPNNAEEEESSQEEETSIGKIHGCRSVRKNVEVLCPT